MTTRESFRQLPKNEQVYTLFNEGRELHERKRGKYLIKLVRVQEIFVEIRYNQIEGRIDDIRVIDKADVARIYGHAVDLGLLSKTP